MKDAKLLDAADAAHIAAELRTALGRGAPPEAQPFALGRDGERAPERLTGLERMGEKVARDLRIAIEPLAQARTAAQPLPLTIHRFGDWLADQPAFTSLSHYRLRPLKGGLLVAVPPALIAGLVERFYGGAGTGTRAQGVRHEFSQSEEMLLGRMLDRLVPIVATHWGEVMAVEASLAQREVQTSHIGFVRGDDAVVVQAFEIGAAGMPAATISLVYPLAMLRPLEAQMAIRIHDEAPAGNNRWRQMLAAALAEVRLPVKSVLARPEISLAELMALKPGDVIPIQLAAHVPLLAGKQAVAEGMIGEQDGRAALRIDRIG